MTIKKDIVDKLRKGARQHCRTLHQILMKYNEMACIAQGVKIVIINNPIYFLIMINK